MMEVLDLEFFARYIAADRMQRLLLHERKNLKKFNKSHGYALTQNQMVGSVIIVMKFLEQEGCFKNIKKFLSIHIDIKDF